MHPSIAQRALLAAIVLVALPLSAATASNCAGTSVGLTPLNELGTQLYHGFDGGLYGGGQNARPPAHDAAGVAIAGAVVPRNAAGQPDPNGVIVILTIGMSNTSIESTAFVPLAEADPLKDPAVHVVNGAQPGQAAEDIDDPAAPYWTIPPQRLAARGFTPAQVAAIWLKEANRQPTLPFPAHADTLSAQLATITRILHDNFPNARLCYLSSRIYAGYATSNLNPEPYAYESCFAVRWTVTRQIGGDPTLNFDPAAGPVVAPWLSWGPYTWADGLIPRGDGLTWECADFRTDDGTHPSASGADKVAHMLLAFFRHDATTTPWYLASPTGVPVAALEAGDGAALQLLPPRPNPATGETVVPVFLAREGRVTARVFGPDGRRVRNLLDDALPAGAREIRWDGRDDAGRIAAAGVYVVRVEAGGVSRAVTATRLR
jgi:hypothetical protein